VKVANADHDFKPVDATKPMEPNTEEIYRITIEFFKENLAKPLE